MNFHLRAIVLTLARGEIPGAHAGDMIETMVEDAGVEPILRSWLMLDNHDTQRLATMLPDTDRRRIAQVLQFTLPGAGRVLRLGTWHDRRRRPGDARTDALGSDRRGRPGRLG
ncbi:MAG: hypothetical protein ACFHWZ_01335 [Phycisphaerales bacterium]